MQGLNIKIENFEGPFDLLLHLIKKNEMDIYDIKIYDITNQYLKYLDELKEFDLEVTSEFIVMAATLLEIKSKMLLPKEKKDDEDEEIDPRKELMEKLIEYKKFKKAAEHLSLKMGEVGLMFAKKAETIEEPLPVSNEELLKGVTMLQLYTIYNELINRYREKINENVIEKEIPADKYKIEDKMEFLKQYLYEKGNIKFSDLMMECECKTEVVVTFLALLELIKESVVKIIQENNFSKIYIERTIIDEK